MKQLTYNNCITIEILLKEGYNTTQISNIIGFNKSTISREIKRNSVNGIYNGIIARNKRQLRQLLIKGGPKRIKKGSKLEAYILEKIKQYWSPEQIAGRRKKETGELISKDTIYSYIYTYHKELVKKYFRRRGNKYIRHRKEKYHIYNRRFIEERPKEVELRNEMGHWEGDTIVGGNHKGAIITLVERKSGYLKAKKVDRYKSDIVSMKIYELMRGVETIKKKTLTVDNGKEFADHMTITGTTGIAIYFARPYSPRQRGTNENTNGLLRQFVRKKTNIRELKESEIDKYVKLINNRPRKRLGYSTPYEVFTNRCFFN